MTSSQRATSLRPGAPLYETLKLARHVAYRNTDHAIAEIVDNSLDAGASEIQILLIEKEIMNTARSTWQVNEIIVFDNGSGMDAETLDKAITISGSGSSNKPGKIGQFGYGLVYSSIYTCNCLDIWSWQDFGPDTAMHSFIDMDDLRGSDRAAHYVPAKQPIPVRLKTLMQIGSTGSGTAVRWSKLQNITWKKSQTVIEKSERIMGRIYRKKLAGNGVSVFFTICREDSNGDVEIIDPKQYIRPNDPMYLMLNTNTPEFSDRPMFEPQFIGGTDQSYQEFSVSMDGDVVGTCRVSCSLVIRDNLFHNNSSDFSAAGAKPWGRHAFENKGISLVREGRELCLCPQLAKEPQDRWWGIEIEFGKELDDFFGVTSDKQRATRFEEALNEYATRMSSPESLATYTQEQTESGEYDATMIRLVHELNEKRRYLLGKVKDFRSSRRSRDQASDEKRANDPTPYSVMDTVSAKASDAKRRYLELHPEEASVEPTIDKASDAELEVLKASLTANLSEGSDGPNDETMLEINRLIKFRRSFMMQEKNYTDSDAFIIPEPEPLGVNRCVFNKSHPFYLEICEALKLLTDDNGEALSLLTNDQTKSLLLKATTGFYIAFACWCELENKALGNEKKYLKEARKSWGEIVRDYLEATGVYEESESQD
jgi:hypothetical protein